MNIKELSTKIQDRLVGEKNISISQSFIHFFLESKISKVNELLNINLNKKSEFPDEIANIFEKIFNIYYYENESRLNSNIILQNDEENLKKINRKSISKSYLIAMEQVKKELKYLVNSYKLQQYVE